MNFTYDSRNIVQSCFFQTLAQLRVKAQTRFDEPQFGDLVPVEVMDILAISRAFIIVVSVKSNGRDLSGVGNVPDVYNDALCSRHYLTNAGFI